MHITRVSSLLGKLSPLRAGSLAGVTAIAIMVAAGAIDAKSLIVVWPLMSAISLLLYCLFSYWSDSGNFLLFLMIVLMPPSGIFMAVMDDAQDRQSVYGRQNSEVT